MTRYPVTPDGRYFVVRARLWRCSNPALADSDRQLLVKALMAARRAVSIAKRAGDAASLTSARVAVDEAKRKLGERGPVWWADGAPDYDRHLVRNTPYASWYAEQIGVEGSQTTPDDERQMSVSKHYRKVIVHIATSADGYIARPDDDIDWLTSRPAPPGFYGIDAFVKTVDTTVLGRRTYEESLRLGGKFDPNSRTVVFSRHPAPADAPAGVEFVSGDVASFVRELREQPGKDIWLMGGADLIAAFLDAGAIDEFVISVVPVFIGDGIPLIARRHRQVELHLESVERFDDGLVQLHYSVQKDS